MYIESWQQTKTLISIRVKIKCIWNLHWELKESNTHNLFLLGWLKRMADWRIRKKITDNFIINIT